ncbi:hypothetical protein DAEQUDRAFT_812220 [Daedalea quercina L-15889]|uniref:Uncharacterized protein n=1 Tax=Daedalea quercina L-15889 TaxID=1314783 RepID=A0A165PIF4_9APHY|nr:hypothetical protein DAEQUDRAFT_812220 [Daedalea quercina L-15889]
MPAPSVTTFTTPGFSNGGGLPMAIARNGDINPNQYIVISPYSFDMGSGRRLSTLNCSTTLKDTPRLSSSGKPLIWFDADIDNNPRWNHMAEGGMLNALLDADPPVVRPTGEIRAICLEGGGKRLESQVEILFEEGELARICCHCGEIELLEICRFERCGGDARRPLYMCFNCAKMSAFRRNVAWAMRQIFDKPK